MSADCVISLFYVNLGLHEYDPDGRKARALEDAIGIKVIKHSKFMFILFFLFQKSLPGLCIEDMDFICNFVDSFG